MFQYIATTLISGEQDAVLVDPPMTIEQTARVINYRVKRQDAEAHLHHSWPRRSLVWHGPASRTLPDITVFAAPGTIEVMHYHASPEGMDLSDRPIQPQLVRLRGN
jgi:hypothetical protein